MPGRLSEYRIASRQTPSAPRNAQIAAFNQEIGARLASLDRGEHVKPETARLRLEKKSRERRKLGA
jgi:hypothetical protein